VENLALENEAGEITANPCLISGAVAQRNPGRNLDGQQIYSPGFLEGMLKKAKIPIQIRYR
jgi:hypothetical protein